MAVGLAQVMVGVVGTTPPPEIPYTSTSASRLYPSGEAVTWTRIRSVVTAGKMTGRQTRVFAVILPFVTVTHPVPVAVHVAEVGSEQYCTLKPVTPYLLNIVEAVGTTGVANASWIEKTSTSVIVF